MAVAIYLLVASNLLSWYVLWRWILSPAFTPQPARFVTINEETHEIHSNWNPPIRLLDLPRLVIGKLLSAY